LSNAIYLLSDEGSSAMPRLLDCLLTRIFAHAIPSVDLEAIGEAFARDEVPA
jgi:hypothetical protein